MWAANPNERCRLKLEVEACPPGTVFGDVACQTSASPNWLDSQPVGGYPPPKGLSLAVRGLQSGTLYRWRARILYAPYAVTRTSITPPPNPAHGPWRRFQAQAFSADLRTMAVWRVFLPVVHRGPQ
jgi:hypothetical protein